MDREAWRAVVHGVPNNRTQLSDEIELNIKATYLSSFHFIFIYTSGYIFCFLSQLRIEIKTPYSGFQSPYMHIHLGSHLVSLSLLLATLSS